MKIIHYKLHLVLHLASNYTLYVIRLNTSDQQLHITSIQEACNCR